MQKEETSDIRKIAEICKTAMECIVSGHYRPLEDRHALTRVSEQDIRRVLKEYNPNFRWYQSAGDHEHQYYEGVYEVYRGQEAMDQVASVTEYGLTMEELEQVLAASMNGYIPGGSRPSDYLYATGELEDERERYQVCLDTFYAVILHNQRLVSSPEEVQEGGNSTLYIGFYLPELGMADLTNCNAGSNCQRQFEIVRKRRRNFVVFRRGG